MIKTFEIKAKEFKNVYKLGRTHLQDAVPTTLGAEFQAYASILKEHQDHLKELKNILYSLNLGGTAIGNSVNASEKYIKEVYIELNKMTKCNFKRASSMMAKTSSQTDFLIISQAITSLCVDLSKIANDFRFMSSGPHGGIGEIILPELQKGSSIMPGKVNPIMPEILNQLYFIVSGNNVSIEKSAEASELELGVMIPIIIDKLLESINLTKEAICQFDRLCLAGVSADVVMCSKHLEDSTAFATLFVPRFGYDFMTQMVKKSIETENNVKDLMLLEGHITDKEIDEIIKNFVK